MQETEIFLMHSRFKICRCKDMVTDGVHCVLLQKQFVHKFAVFAGRGKILERGTCWTT